jgi:GTPase KRas protein
MSVYNVVVVGTGGVGKSSLTIQFISQQFIEDYDPTIEDSYRKRVTVDAVSCLLDILDTAGHDNFSAMPVLHTQFQSGSNHRAQGYVCIYSISSRSSFEELATHLRARVPESNDVPMVLVGNKCDLEASRVVSTAEGHDLAKSFGCQFLEASAKSHINVEQSFFYLVRDIRKRQSLAGEGHKKLSSSKPTNKKCSLF